MLQRMESGHLATGDCQSSVRRSGHCGVFGRSRPTVQHRKHALYQAAIPIGLKGCYCQCFETVQTREAKYEEHMRFSFD